MKKLPAHLNMTLREFKKWKRRQFMDVCNMIENSKIRNGCAFLPQEQYQKLEKALSLLRETRDELKAWWKKA